MHNGTQHPVRPYDSRWAEKTQGCSLTNAVIVATNTTAHQAHFFKGMDAARQQRSSRGVLLSMLGGCMRFPGECLGINIHCKVLKVPRFPPPPKLFRGSANCKVFSGIPADSQSNANQHKNPPSLSSLQGIWVLYVGHWNCIYILSPTIRETLYIEI